MSEGFDPGGAYSPWMRVSASHDDVAGKEGFAEVWEKRLAEGVAA